MCLGIIVCLKSKQVSWLGCVHAKILLHAFSSDVTCQWLTTQEVYTSKFDYWQCNSRNIYCKEISKSCRADKISSYLHSESDDPYQTYMTNMLSCMKPGEVEWNHYTDMVGMGMGPGLMSDTVLCWIICRHKHCGCLTCSAAVAVLGVSQGTPQRCSTFRHVNVTLVLNIIMWLYYISQGCATAV